MPEIKLGKRTIPYSIRESKRARYVNFAIHVERGLEVVIPYGTTVRQDDVENEMFQRQEWILRHLGRLEKIKAKAAYRRQFVSGEIIPYRGDDHKLEVIQTHRARKTSVARQGMHLRVRLRAGVAPEAQSDEVRGALEKWFRQQAKKIIPKRAKELAAQYDFEYGYVRIRAQKSRWGSCSTLGNLNFNWRLVLAPPEVMDYVILHELCHLIVQNHSPLFWATLSLYCPDYDVWEHWLKRYGFSLYL